MSDILNPADIGMNVKEDQSLHQAAKAHRRKIRRVKHRGFKSHIQACSTCGHYICRCQDIKRREEIKGVMQ
ncbi:hypothetical protein [Methanolobus sp. ZRKC5]|uniref:hypothetical protein n=1 Tax=unclassified Methanolobus TaxID=2629569 RepID=UPI00313DE372